MGFLSHEVSHGAMELSKRWRTFFTGLGFAPFFVTASFWEKWHNAAHHGNTNIGDSDPDSFGTKLRYRLDKKQKKWTRIAPGSGKWYSYFFLFYSFVMHSQVVLWVQTKTRKEFKGFNRAKAIRHMFYLVAFWIGLAFIFGTKAALFGILIPMMIGNAIVQSYILTNHFLRPQSLSNNSLDNSMSLKKWGWVDRMHFRFSHHVEHHIFPKLPSNKLPKIKQWLQENTPEKYVCPSHIKALFYLYTTPRVYANAYTLVDVDNPKRKIDLLELQRKLNPIFFNPALELEVKQDFKQYTKLQRQHTDTPNKNNKTQATKNETKQEIENIY